MFRNRNGRAVFVLNKRRWTAMFFSVLVLSVLIEPPCIAATLDTVHAVYRILKYIITAVVLFVFIIRRTRLNVLLLGTVVFESCLFLSTLIRGGDLYIWARNGAYCVILLLFMQMVLLVDSDLLFEAVSIILGLYVHINTLTWVLFPEGMYINDIGYRNCWFLDYDNCAAAIIVLVEIVALYRIVSSYHKFNLWDWSILISGTVFIFKQMVASAIVAVVPALFFLLLTRKEGIRKVIGNARLIVLGMIVLFFLIQFFSIQESGIFALIFLLLGKDSTFTGRTRVWKLAWEDLRSKNLLLGMGMQKGTEYASRFGGRVFGHVHCYYLQVLYDGGVLAFGSFVFLLFQIAKRFDSNKKDYCDMVLLAGLIAFMIMWQAEAYSTLLNYFFILLFLLYNAPVFRHQQKAR